MLRVLPLEATPMTTLIREHDWTTLHQVLSAARGSVDSWGIRTCRYLQLDSEKQIPLIQILQRILDETEKTKICSNPDALVSVVAQLNRIHQETTTELVKCSLPTLVLNFFSDLHLLQGGFENESNKLDHLEIAVGVGSDFVVVEQ
ncbi:MAG: hypothetical protein V4492_02925 [Chlamydiota bacterium]